MTLGEREEIVVYFIGIPALREYIMAFSTFRRKPRLLVIRIGRCHEIFQVATGAIISDPVEHQAGGGAVAFIATDGSVYAIERETIFLVNSSDIIDQPIGIIVATGAIGTCCLLVHIGMAGNTFGFGFRENKRTVAGATVSNGVPPFERKPCFAVVKLECVCLLLRPCGTGENRFVRIEPLPAVGTNFPAIRGMASRTVEFHLSTVRILGQEVNSCQQ